MLLKTRLETFTVNARMLAFLAPENCLQYFSSGSGTVQSFNWKDVTGKTRQLANQNYRVCLRSELIDGKVSCKITLHNSETCVTVIFFQSAKSICLTACSATAFSLSSDASVDAAAQTIEPNFCPTDYLSFSGGYNKDSKEETSDRFCGTAFSAKSADIATTVTVCSESPFTLSSRNPVTKFFSFIFRRREAVCSEISNGRDRRRHCHSS